MVFVREYRCFSASQMPRDTKRDRVEHGGKIVLPESALSLLTSLEVAFPYLFKLTNGDSTTHCGVLEFVAQEGRVYVPAWMRQNLGLEEEGEPLRVEAVSLPVATFTKFCPEPDFMAINDPKTVLETILRSFACLSTGDVIAIWYNGRAYELAVRETEPADAVSVINCDLSVDFEVPVEGMETDDVPASDTEKELDVAAMMPPPQGTVPFSGTGHRIDGKKSMEEQESGGEASTSAPVGYVRGIPDYNWEVGTITFIRGNPKIPAAQEDDEKDSIVAFQGEGHSLVEKKCEEENQASDPDEEDSEIVISDFEDPEYPDDSDYEDEEDSEDEEDIDMQ